MRNNFFWIATDLEKKPVQEFQNKMNKVYLKMWPDFENSVLMSHWNTYNYSFYGDNSKRDTELSKYFTLFSGNQV